MPTTVSKSYSGFTEGTAQKLLLDAGAYFKNFIVGEDTFETAVEGDKLIGATSGGGTFSAVPEVKDIEIDGVWGPTVGLTRIISWDVNMMATIKEISAETAKLALGAAQVEDGPEGYKKITANNDYRTEDYIDNIVWIGRLSGSGDPVIIEILNALSVEGINLTMADKDEATIPTTLTAHYKADDLDTPPFAIYYPDTMVEVASATMKVGQTSTVKTSDIKTNKKKD